MKPQTYNVITKIILLTVATAFFLLVSPAYFSVFATVGIYHTINFQGKVVNKSDGTNIADNTYSLTFKFYDAGISGNQLPVGSPWSETQSLPVTSGIFRATLGSVTPIPSTLDFNSDSLYLDITFNGETFTTRVRMTAVPYAFNAERVNGLNVTNTTGTLTIPSGQTIAFSGANNLTLTTIGATTATLPSGTVTLVDLASTQTLTSKTIGSTGLTFSGATTGITTVSNQNFTIVPNGTGFVGIGTTSPSQMLTVSGSATASGNITMGGQLQVGLYGGDPATLGNGSIVYNSLTNAFRCYQNGAWTNCIGSGGTPTWSSIQAPTGNLSLNMAAWTTTFTWGNATGTGINLFNLTDSTSNSGTGYLFNLGTATGSNLQPFHVASAGTEAILVNKSGNVGIGNTSPTEKLDVVGNATVSGNLTLANSVPHTIATRSFNDLNIGDTNTGNLTLSVGTGKQIRFYGTSNYINSSGNLTLAGTINGLTITPNGTNTLNITAGKTLAISNSLTFNGTDSTSFTFPGTTGGTVLTSNQASQTITSTQATGNVLGISDTSLTTGKALVITGGTAVTTGGDMEINGAVYVHIAAETGNLINATFSDASTNTSGTSTTNGININSTVNTSGGGTKNINAVNVSAPTLTACATGSCTWAGLQINTQTSTNTLITQNGLSITPNATGTSGTLNGISIGNITTPGSGTAIGLNIGTGWSAGLNIASAATISATLNATGSTVIGSSGNTFTLNPASGPVYAGTARPYKTIVLSPEYSGASLTAFYGAGTEINITGNMTSDASTSAGLRTHYAWTGTTPGTLQSYTIAVRVQLPQDFSQWCITSVCTNTNALQIDYATLNSSASNNALDVNIYNSSNTSTAVYSSTGNATSANTWTTLSIQKASLEGSQTWNTPGDIAIIYLRMKAMNNNFVLVGDIKLNYLGKF